MSFLTRTALAGGLAVGIVTGAGANAWAGCKLYICVSGIDIPQSQNKPAYHAVSLTTSMFSGGERFHFNAIVPGRSQFQVNGNVITIPEHPGEELVYSVEACSEPSAPFQRSICTGWSQFNHRVPGG
jgi:hypothetical protein